MTEGPFLRNHWSVVASGTLRAAAWSVLIPVVMLASYDEFSLERALLTAGALVAVSAAANIVIWRRTRYYFLEDEMTVERNTVFRSETRIQYDRLASVNEERDPVCRLLGAVRLSFNLNSSVNASKAEAFIVLKADEAAELRARMDSRIFGRPSPSVDEAAEEPASLVDVSFTDILLHSLFGMPSAQVGIGAVTLAYSLFTFFGLGTPSIAAVVLFVLDFLLPAASSFLRLYGYRITRSGDMVSVSSGLLSTREDSFLLSKVNCVRVREPFLCRLMGRAILEVEVVGTANGKGVPLLCPLKRRSVALSLFHSLLPEFECSAEPMGQCRVASAGILLKAGAAASAVLAAAILFVMYGPAAEPEIVAASAALGILLCAFWAVMAYRTRAFACDGDIAMLVVGACDRVSDYILMDKIQFADVRSSPIQRRKGAASCRISMLSTSGAASVTSGVFPAEELEKVSSTVLARIKDGRYDFRRFQRRPADGMGANRLCLYRRTNFNRSAFQRGIIGGTIMGMGNTPVIILREGTKREKGKDAQFNNIAAAKAISDAVRSSLGPRGMDKMLVDSMGDVVITNDGVTILKEMDVQHPAAKMLVEVAKTQDAEVGDGTTTSVILAGELLKKATDLIDANVHPTIIANGYRLANAKAQEVLKNISKKVSIDDEESLKLIAQTAMISKSVSGSKEHFSEMVVDAVKTVVDKGEDGKYTVDLKNIQTVKKAGAKMDESYIVKGLIIDKEPVQQAMPKVVENAKIALVDAAFEVKKTEIDAKIQITDPSQIAAFVAEEENMLREMVDKVKASGANVVFCQKGIDDLAQHFFAKAGIYACRRVKKSDMERLGRSTGANIVNKIMEIDSSDLGYADKVELKKVEDEEMTFIMGVKDPKTVSVLVRGGTNHVADEVERSLVDAWSVVKVAIEDGMMVTGGGSTAMEIAMQLRDYAASVGGRAQIAIEAYASAMEVIPSTLAENAGHDPIDVVIEMRKQHKAGKVYAGFNPYTGKVEDMSDLNVIEPYRIGKQAINSATDAAVMILRIDDVIAARGGNQLQTGDGMPGMDDD